MSVLREAISRVLAMRHLNWSAVLAELNAVLRRTEEARIHHWYKQTGTYPPRRSVAVAENEPAAPVESASSSITGNPLQ